MSENKTSTTVRAFSSSSETHKELVASRPRLKRHSGMYVFRTAKRVEISDHDSGTRIQWEPYYEQVRIWEKIADGRDVFFLKVRQIGASTAVLLDDILWLVGNDSRGEKVKCGLFINTEKNAEEQLRRAKEICDSLDIAYIPRNDAIEFPNGSMFHFNTAGSKRAGASFSYQRLHLTELPFWRDANNSLSSLLQVMSKKGQVIIETTMGLDDLVAMDLWTKENQFDKVFFEFEDHAGYRQYDEDHPDFPLTDDDEEWLRKEGFTSKASMRYWLWLLRNRNAGDVAKNFREYPQKPEHSYRFAEGRWCSTDPKVLDPVSSYELPGVPGKIHILRDPKVCSHHCVIGVDTSGGKGRDRSTAVVVDGRDGRIVAYYVSDIIKVYNLAHVAESLQQRYKFRKTIDNTKVIKMPPILVEVNGVGQGTADELWRLKAKTVCFDSGESNKQRFMEIADRRITSGHSYGPKELLDEVQQLRVKNGKFLGKKDLFITTGFCYDWVDRHPYRPLPVAGSPNTFSISERKRRQ